MGFITITKTRKPRQFSYIPRYYDERKEKLQAIIARASQSEGGNTISDFATNRMRLEFSEARTKRVRQNVKMQQLRIILILGALILLLYVYFRL